MVRLKIISILINAKNPQIKHYLCSKYVMIYRPEKNKKKTKTKTAKNVTKN